MVRLAKAVARLDLREKVTKADVELVLAVLKDSLTIPLDAGSKKL